MLSLLLYIIYLAVLGVCFILSIIFIILAIAKRRNKRRVAGFAVLSILSIILTALLWKLDVFSAETNDKEKEAVAFRENFGFPPPASITEIKVKNFFLYDAGAHWMSFRYDSVVFNKILMHDRPLNTAAIGTPKYEEIRLSLKNGCANCPGWLTLPGNGSSKIYYKKDFMEHTSSEYYLWVDEIEKRVYLAISYFD